MFCVLSQQLQRNHIRCESIQSSSFAKNVPRKDLWTWETLEISKLQRWFSKLGKLTWRWTTNINQPWMCYTSTYLYSYVSCWKGEVHQRLLWWLGESYIAILTHFQGTITYRILKVAGKMMFLFPRSPGGICSLLSSLEGNHPNCFIKFCFHQPQLPHRRLADPFLFVFHISMMAKWLPVARLKRYMLLGEKHTHTS